MRTFDDPRGRPWQAALLEASYGSIALVFSPLYGDGLRRLSMPAQTLTEAEAELAALDAAALRSLLDRAQLWNPGNDPV